MSTLLFLTTFLFVGVCLRASGSLRDLLAASQISNRDPESPLSLLRPLRSTLFSTPSTSSTVSTPSTSPDSSVSVRACRCSSVPSPAASSHISNPKSEIPDPLCLLPEPLADALETLTAELRRRLASYRHLAPSSAARRARRDARFAVRLRAIYATIARVHDADPAARPVDPSDFLPSLTATELSESEKYLGELTTAWRIYEAHPTAAEFDRALRALSRITALRRSLFDLARFGPPPEAFPGWDADHDLNPFDESFEPIFPDGVDRPACLPPDAAPLTPTQLLDRLLAPTGTPSVPQARHGVATGDSSRRSPQAKPEAGPEPLAPHRSPLYTLSIGSTGSTSTPSTAFSASSSRPRRPRTLSCIPRWLLRLVRRFGAWLLYLRPHHLNPVIRKLALLAGLIVLYFPPPEDPPEKMSAAEAAWWRAEEQRRIRLVFRPEVEGSERRIPPTSLPPWGFDDPPWET